MDIVILGAGNVAFHLANALHANGYHIKQVFSKTMTSAKQLADCVESDYTIDINAIDKQADLYIYALKDSILEDIIVQIDAPNAIHVHTAGSISIDVFDSNKTNFGVLYPLQTLSKTKPIDFKQVPLFIEANNQKTQDQLLNLACKLSFNTSLANSHQRMKLHLAAVFACNFSNYMYTVAAQLVNESDLSFDILKPLIQETAEKIKTIEPKFAQTGPAVRFDTNVMDKHLYLLQTHPELSEIYKILSKQIYANSIK